MGTDERHQPGPVVVGLGIGLGLPAAGWFAIGPDHVVFAAVTQCAFLLMALLVGPALVDVRRSRYRVRAAEPRLYVLVGAEMLRRILDIVGWNRVIAHMRRSESGISGVARFLRGTEQSETAHLLGIIATVLLAVTALFTAHFIGAGQILALGVVLHAYPVMIQRIVRSRLMDRRAARAGMRRC